MPWTVLVASSKDGSYCWKNLSFPVSRGMGLIDGGVRLTANQFAVVWDEDMKILWVLVDQQLARSRDGFQWCGPTPPWETKPAEWGQFLIKPPEQHA